MTSKRFFSTTVSKSMPGGSGLLLVTATASASTTIVLLLVRLAASAAVVGLSYAAFFDDSIFFTKLTVGQQIVVVVDEDRMNHLIDTYTAQCNDIEANLREIVSTLDGAMVEVKSVDWNELTRADYDQMVELFNSLIDYTNELRTLSETAVKVVFDLRTIKDVGLNAIQAGDPDITSKLNGLYEIAVSLGRETVLSLGTLTSNLTELDTVMTFVRGMVIMNSNPFL